MPNHLNIDIYCCANADDSPEHRLSVVPTTPEPAERYKEFLLFAHPNGLWTEKINRKTRTSRSRNTAPRSDIEELKVAVGADGVD
jgi:hypothetical protein